MASAFKTNRLLKVIFGITATEPPGVMTNKVRMSAVVVRTNTSQMNNAPSRKIIPTVFCLIKAGISLTFTFSAMR